MEQIKYPYDHLRINKKIGRYSTRAEPPDHLYLYQNQLKAALKLLRYRRLILIQLLRCNNICENFHFALVGMLTHLELTSIRKWF